MVGPSQATAVVRIPVCYKAGSICLAEVQGEFQGDATQLGLCSRCQLVELWAW